MEGHMESNVLLTVIVPASNMEKHLVDCLKSLVIEEPLMDRTEIIIAVYGSEDGTLEAAAGFQRVFPEIVKVLPVDLGGYGACVNSALKIARGVFTRILDGDDTMNTAKYAAFVRFLAKKLEKGGRIDLVLSDCLALDKHGRTLEHWMYPLKAGNEVLGLSDLHYLSGRLRIQTVTYRTKFIRDIGYRQDEGMLYTEQEWAYIPFVQIDTFTYFPAPVVNYYGRHKQRDYKPRLYGKNQWMDDKGKRRIIMALSKRELPKEIRAEFERLLSRWMAGMFRTVLFSANAFSDNEVLKTFDSFMKTFEPGLYKRMPDEALARHMEARFIEIWRNNNCFKNCRDLRKLRGRYSIYSAFTRTFTVIFGRKLSA